MICKIIISLKFSVVVHKQLTKESVFQKNALFFAVGMFYLAFTMYTSGYSGSG